MSRFLTSVLLLACAASAFDMGDRFGGPAIRQASRGYAVASIEYRLAPESIWPAQVQDTRPPCAGCARTRSVSGSTRTASLSSAPPPAGTSPPSPPRARSAEHEGLELGNPQFSSRVKVVVDLYGPTDLLRIEEDKLPCIPLDGNAPFMPPSLLMGCPIQTCREWTRTASPMSYVTPDDPPFLIMHGLLDCLVPFRQSIALHEALEAAGVESTLVLLPRGEHGGRAFDEEKYERMVDEFLDSKLRAPVVGKRRSVRR